MSFLRSLVARSPVRSPLGLANLRFFPRRCLSVSSRLPQLHGIKFFSPDLFFFLTADPLLVPIRIAYH